MKTIKQTICFLLCLSMLHSSTFAAGIQYVDDEKTDPYNASYPEENKEKVDIGEFISLVKGFDENLGEIQSCKPIITLGNTGSGKSTTILYLKGQEFVRVNSENKNTNDGYPMSDNSEPEEEDEGSSSTSKGPMRVDLKDEKKRGDIGHGDGSKTLGPSLHRLDRGLSICDFAGFFDNRGYLQKISIALSTRYVIEKSAGIKAILFVVTEGDLTGGNRGDAFGELLKILGMMFKDPSAHAQSIFFGLTIRKNWKNEKGLKDFFKEKRQGYRTKIYNKYNGIGKDTQNNIMKAKSIIGIRNALQKDSYYGKVKEQEMKKSKEQKLSQGNEETWIRGYAFLNAIKDYQKNNIFCVNPLQPQERKDIIDRFIASPVIDKKKIGSVGDKSTIRLLNQEFEQQAKEGLTIISTISREKESIEDKKSSIQSMKDDIRGIKNGKLNPGNTIKKEELLIKESKEKIRELTRAIEEKDVSDEEEVFCMNYYWSNAYKDFNIIDKLFGTYYYFEMDDFTCRSYRCLNYRMTAFKSLGTKPKDVHDDKVRFYEPDGTFYSDSYIWTYYPKPANNFSIRINAESREVHKELISAKRNDKDKEEEKLKNAIEAKEKIEKAFEELRENKKTEKEGKINVLNSRIDEHAKELEKLVKNYKETERAFSKKESLFDFIQLCPFLTKGKGVIQDFSNCYKKFKEENQQEEKKDDQ